MGRWWASKVKVMIISLVNKNHINLIIMAKLLQFKIEIISLKIKKKTEI
jgi:hypothetical protein